MRQVLGCFMVIILVANWWNFLPSVQAVVSNFGFDAEGWKIVDMKSSGPYLNPLSTLANPAPYSGDIGNPGGCILWPDTTNKSFYFEAPSLFLGNQAGAYGTNLTFDIKTDHNNYTSDPLVILVSSGTALVFAVPEAPPLNAWKAYQVPLSETGWHVGTVSGAAPTQSQFQGVLGDLTAFRICGEFGGAIEETTHLDNVSLVTPPNTFLWTGATDGIWGKSTNWDPQGIPGSGEQALFQNTVSHSTIDLAGDRQIKQLIFQSAAASPYTLINNTMILDEDGAVEVHANVVNDQAINSRLALAGNATLTNNSTAAEQELLIGGNIDSAASDGVQTLTLGGAGNGTISGDLDDGSTGGAIGLTKMDDGVWRLLGASAYTGPTSVTGGTLYVQNLSHTSAVSVNGSGTQLIVNSIQTPMLTIGGGEKIALSGACGGGDAARVPEPATGVLLAAAAVLLLLRWRGRR